MSTVYRSFTVWVLLLLLLGACQPVMPVESSAAPLPADLPAAELQIATVPMLTGTWVVESDATPFYLMLAADGVMRIADESPLADPLCVGHYTVRDGKVELQCEMVDPTGCLSTNKAVYSVQATLEDGLATHLHFVLDTVELCAEHRFVLDGATLARAPAVEMPVAALDDVAGVWMLESEGAPFYLMLEPGGAMRIAEGAPDAAPLCTGSYTVAGGMVALTCEVVDPTGCLSTQQAIYRVMAVMEAGQVGALHFVLDTVELCTEHRLVLDDQMLTRAPAREVPATSPAELAGVWMMAAGDAPLYLIMEPNNALRITMGAPDAAPLCIGRYAVDNGKVEFVCETVDPTGCLSTQQAVYSVLVRMDAGKPTQLRFAVETVELCTEERFVLDGVTLVPPL